MMRTVLNSAACSHGMRRRIVNIEDSSLTTDGRVMFCNRPNAGLDRFLLRSSRFDQLRDVQLLQSLRGDGGAAGTREENFAAMQTPR